MPAEGDLEIVATTAYGDVQQQRLLGSLQLRLSYMGLLSLIVSAMLFRVRSRLEECITRSAATP